MEKLGDRVKRWTGTLGIEQCDSCRERQKWLNELDTKLRQLLRLADAAKEVDTDE